MSTLADTGFWILTALAAGRRHGYAVLRDVADATGTTPKVTTLYATLERLETQGLISADGEEIVDGRARRYFALTDAGARRLAEETDRLELRARAARAALARGRAAMPAASTFAAGLA